MDEFEFDEHYNDDELYQEEIRFLELFEEEVNKQGFKLNNKQYSFDALSKALGPYFFIRVNELYEKWLVHYKIGLSSNKFEKSDSNPWKRRRGTERSFESREELDKAIKSDFNRMMYEKREFKVLKGVILEKFQEKFSEYINSFYTESKNDKVWIEKIPRDKNHSLEFFCFKIFTFSFISKLRDERSSNKNAQEMLKSEYAFFKNFMNIYSSVSSKIKEKEINKLSKLKKDEDETDEEFNTMISKRQESLERTPRFFCNLDIDSIHTVLNRPEKACSTVKNFIEVNDLKLKFGYFEE